MDAIINIRLGVTDAASVCVQRVIHLLGHRNAAFKRKLCGTSGGELSFPDGDHEQGDCCEWLSCCVNEIEKDLAARRLGREQVGPGGLSGHNVCQWFPGPESPEQEEAVLRWFDENNAAFCGNLDVSGFPKTFCVRRITGFHLLS